MKLPRTRPVDVDVDVLLIKFWKQCHENKMWPNIKKNHTQISDENIRNSESKVLTIIRYTRSKFGKLRLDKRKSKMSKVYYFPL